MAQRKRWYLEPAAPGSILGEGRKFSEIKQIWKPWVLAAWLRGSVGTYAPAASGSISGEGRKFSGIIFGKKLMFIGKSTPVDCLWCEECKKLNNGWFNTSSTDMWLAGTTKKLMNFEIPI